MGKGNGPEQGKTGKMRAGWERAKKSPCFWLFLVISALFSVLFARFWLGDYAYLYLDVGADTFDINYPLYRLFSDALHSGEYEDYFLNVGLGMDMSSYFYQYLNPLNLLVLVLPERLIPWGILLASYLKLLLTGLSGYGFFVRVIRRVPSEAAKAAAEETGDSRATVLGSFAAALAWTFSGYLMLWGQHYGFAASIAMFTVFLYLVQRFVEDEEKSLNWILVLWITLMLFTNYYFLYMSGLMGALYVAAYLLFCRKGWKVILRRLLGLAGMGILGICIGGGCLTATWNVFQDSIRAGTVALELSSVIKPYDLPWLLGFLGRLFTNNAMGIGDGYTGPGNYYEIAMLCTSGLFIYGLFYLIIGKKTRKGTLCLTVLSAVMLALPLTGKLFTMNSGTQRWSFLLCLLEALAAGAFLRLLWEEKNRRKMAGSVGAGLLFAALSCGLLLWGQSQGYYDLYLKYLGLAMGFLVLYGIFFLVLAFGWNRKNAVQGGSLVLTGLLCAELAVSNFPTINFRENPTRNQVAMEYYNDGTEEAARAASAEEKGPYRIAKTYESASENDSMAQGYPGLSVYLTTNPRELIQLKNMYGGQGVSINFADFNDEDYLRNALLGVKYLLAQPETMVSDETWEYLGEAGGKAYYEYRYALPFGYLYDRQWDGEELQEMDETERVLASFLGFHFGGSASDTVYPRAEASGAEERRAETGGSEGSEAEIAGSKESEAETARSEENETETAGTSLTDLEQGISLLDRPMEVKDCGAIRDENGILVDEMTEDPHVIFSEVETAFGEGPIHTVTVQAEVPKETDLALYYKTGEDRDFSQEQIRIFTLSPGQDTWTGTLPEDVTQLRLDISTAVEQVLVKDIRVNNCTELNQAYEALQDSPVTEITWEENTYQARVNNEKEQTQMLCVPFLYSQGWQASVDQTEVPVYNINSGLTGIEIPSGSHEVTLVYESPGKLEGRILTIAGILVYGAVFGLGRLRKSRGFMDKRSDSP